MRPENLNTQFFLDSGDPEETKAIIEKLGFVDGQTTNPSLIAKSPGAKERLEAGNKFSRDEVNEYYKETVSAVRSAMPHGSISVEVYADADTSAEEMIEQGTAMNAWIPEAHIKLPTTAEGLKAARHFVDQGINVNLTLVFSQQQAAAVYAATTGAKKGQVYLSPFIGRLDDIGQNGMDLIANIVKMYKEKGDGHVEVLTASVRSLDHFLASIAVGTDIITSPGKWMTAWADAGMEVPAELRYAPEGLAPMPYEEIDLDQPVEAYNLQHDLTDKGLQRFADDWNNLIA